MSQHGLYIYNQRTVSTIFGALFIMVPLPPSKACVCGVGHWMLTFFVIWELNARVTGCWRLASFLYASAESVFHFGVGITWMMSCNVSLWFLGVIDEIHSESWAEWMVYISLWWLKIFGLLQFMWLKKVFKETTVAENLITRLRKSSFVQQWRMF